MRDAKLMIVLCLYLYVLLMYYKYFHGIIMHHTELCKLIRILTIYDIISGIFSYTVFGPIDEQQC